MKKLAKMGVSVGLVVLLSLAGRAIGETVVVQDNFNRENTDILGATSDGQCMWNQDAETRMGFHIVDNQLVPYIKSTGTGWAGGIALNDLNVDDGSVRIHVKGSLGHDSTNGIALGYRAENAAALKTVTAPGAFHLYLIPHDAGADEDWAYIMLFAGSTNLGTQWAHIGDLNDDFWLEASFDGDQHWGTIYESDGGTVHDSWTWTSDYRTDGMVGFTSNWIFAPFDDFQVTFESGVTNMPGDANGDGMVDVGDLGILAGNYGLTSGATWAQGDFNEDGAVDVGDLGILAGNYGAGTAPTNSVPEPMSLGLLGLGGILFIGRKR